MKDACPICCDTFTGFMRKKIACAACDFTACAACCEKYLLSTSQDPHCMQCRAAWTREFIDTSFTKAFVTNRFKVHRETVLLDREKAMLPASHAMVTAYQRAQGLRADIARDEARVTELAREIGRLQVAAARSRTELNRIVGANYCVEDLEAEEVERERKRFIMPCPAGDCRGFLSAAYKCGTCDTYVCQKCHAVKAGRDDPDHECDPDAVATVALIRRETKSCPRCGVPTQRSSGCPQMFCTACH
jgi:hypothetical protein